MNTFKQNLKLPKGVKSEGNAAIAVYLITLEIKKNYSENKATTFSSENGFIQLNSCNIHSKTFDYRLGKEYRKYIDEAISNGDILISKNNGKEIYSNSSTRKNVGFTKTYSLNPQIFDNLKREDYFLLEVQIKKKRNYKKNRFNASKRKESLANTNSEKLEENIMHNDPYSAKLQTYYKDLYFSENLYDQPFYDYFDVSNNKIIDFVNDKTVELKDYSDKNRFYHPLIMMNREYRKFVRSKNGELTIIDATSLVPFLLGKFITDHSEKNQWLKICASGEFYTKIGGVDQSEKEHYKKLFQVVLSGKTSKGSKLKDLENKLRKDFPSVMRVVDKINASDKTVVSIMQKLENKIFRNENVKNSNLWHLPMHDGVLCYKEDVNVFIKLLEDASFSVLGYKLIFTKENISNEPEPPQTPALKEEESEDTTAQFEQPKNEKDEEKEKKEIKDTTDNIDEYFDSLLETELKDNITDEPSKDTELDEMFDFLEQDPDREVSLDVVME